jgi:hypothetical protein
LKAQRRQALKAFTGGAGLFPERVAAMSRAMIGLAGRVKVQRRDWSSDQNEKATPRAVPFTNKAARKSLYMPNDWPRALANEKPARVNVPWL